MATMNGASPSLLKAEHDPATVTAARRLLEAGDTLCISQVESVGFRMLLKRAHELASLHSKGEQALQSIEDLAQLLGFCTANPLELGKHAERLAEEFTVTSIAELVDYPDTAPASVAGIVTNLRLRTTRKGEKMAWLTLADATGALGYEGAVRVC